MKESNAEATIATSEGSASKYNFRMVRSSTFAIAPMLITSPSTMLVNSVNIPVLHSALGKTI
jgi:hypothetical protein